ncbi:phosphoglycerate mutase-like protein [Apiospora arundinis]|uniref:3-phytase n=1 Tax=Apiospora arundinis TaxID=335852 RepID=A0ABR2IRT5_9PEZI
MQSVLSLSLALTARVSAMAVSASPYAGSPTSDLYPPASTSVNSKLFPPESVVGFAGPTPTGVEPAAAYTAPIYPFNNEDSSSFPLVAPHAHGSGADSTFNMKRSWGNLSPWYSVPSADYGLPDANPLIPGGCTITQLHLLYRHGARYPTSDAAPAQFAEKIANATKKDGFTTKGDLEFLSTWTYKLGAELLTPFGRSQEFLLGLEHRQLYGELLNNFTEQGTLPVFRTESQDRMVKTAVNFAAGFFGVPEYMDEVSIEILVEAPHVNSSGSPYYVCPNADVKSKGYIGTAVSNAYAELAFNATQARLNSHISGLKFDAKDIISMLQLCSYETVALGYSSFCKLFSEEDFFNYEYFYDLRFYYENGPGSPVSAAQGKGYLQEFVARFTHEYPTPSSALNETFDNSSTYFPLNQSIYADATHEVVVLDTLTAFNLSALFKGPPLNLKQNEQRNSFSTSKVIPFATHFTAQVLECPAYQPTKQIRFIVNDAVLPINESYPGCEANPHGLCSFDNVVEVLKKRINEIDFDHDCYGNYTAKAGVDYNGRAPRD